MSLLLLFQGASSPQPSRRDWLSTVVSAWVPPDPTPTLPRLLNASLTAVEVDNPPFGVDYVQQQLPASQWKPIPDPLPTLNQKLLAGRSVDNPPFGLSDLALQVATQKPWQPDPPPLPTLPRLLNASLTAVEVDNPPFGLTDLATQAATLKPWQPDAPPLPTLGNKLVQGPVTQATSFKRDWLSTVAAAWVPPDPTPTLPRLLNASLTAVEVDNPPFGLYDPQSQSAALPAWLPAPAPQPAQPSRVPPSQAAVVNNPPFGASVLVPVVAQPIYIQVANTNLALVNIPASQPFSRAWLDTVLSAWNPPAPAPILPRLLNASITAVEVDNPPFGLYDPQSQAAALPAWLPVAQPLPTLSVRLVQSAGAAPPVVNNPPFGNNFLVPIATQATYIQVAPNFIAPIAIPPAVNNPPFGLDGLDSQLPISLWRAPDPAPILPRKLNPSLLASLVNNPPFGLYVLRAQPILVGWNIDPPPLTRLPNFASQTVVLPPPPPPNAFVFPAVPPLLVQVGGPPFGPMILGGSPFNMAVSPPPAPPPPPAGPDLEIIGGSPFNLGGGSPPPPVAPPGPPPQPPPPPVLTEVPVPVSPPPPLTPDTHFVPTAAPPPPPPAPPPPPPEQHGPIFDDPGNSPFETTLTGI